MQSLQEMDPLIEDLLSPSVDDKSERRAKIRELMEEVRTRHDKEDVLVSAHKLSEKWSSRGLNL